MLARDGLFAAESVIMQLVVTAQRRLGTLTESSFASSLASYASCGTAGSTLFQSSVYLAKVSTKLMLASRVLIPVLGAGLICALMSLEWESKQGAGQHDDELHPGHSGPISGAESQYTGGSHYNTHPKYAGP
jgi:hypothetical protein